MAPSSERSDPMNCPLPALGTRARDFVLDRLSEADRIEFEDHLVGCAACVDRVSSLESRLLAVDREAQASETRRIGWFGQLHWSAALAAGILLVVLGYPAYLGIVRLPGAQGEMRQLGDRKVALEGELGKLREERSKSEARIAELEKG